MSSDEAFHEIPQFHVLFQGLHECGAQVFVGAHIRVVNCQKLGSFDQNWTYFGMFRRIPSFFQLIQNSITGEKRKKNLSVNRHVKSAKVGKTDKLSSPFWCYFENHLIFFRL